MEYASHGDFMRKQLKVIRTKEESLDNLKRCRRNARRKAKDVDKKLSKMGPVHKNLAAQKESLVHLQEEIRKMDSGITLEEAALSDFKRTATKAWMGLKFGGLVECCQKGTVRNLNLLCCHLFFWSLIVVSSPIYRLRANLGNWLLR